MYSCLFTENSNANTVALMKLLYSRVVAKRNKNKKKKEYIYIYIYIYIYGVTEVKKVKRKAKTLT